MRSKTQIKITFLLLSIILLGVTFLSTLNLSAEQDITEASLHNQTNLSEIQSSTLNNNPNLARIIFDMFMDILPNGKDTVITCHFTYQNTGGVNVSSLVHVIDITTILTESRISSISVYDGFGDLYYEWDIIDSTHLLYILLREELQPQDFYSFSISYLLENSIIPQTEIIDSFILQWTITHDEVIQQFSLTLTLPYNYALLNQTDIVPTPDYRSIDDRRLEWNFNDIEADQDHSWIIRFNDYTGSTTTGEPIKKWFWSMLVVAFVVGGLIGSLSMFFYNKSRSDSERKEIVETLLSKPEIEILKIIKGEGDVTTQKKIKNITGFSPAKVSYYLTELEKKEIILRERWGRMNRIRIIDDSVDKVYFSDDKETKE